MTWQRGLDATGAHRHEAACAAGASAPGATPARTSASATGSRRSTATGWQHRRPPPRRRGRTDRVGAPRLGGTVDACCSAKEHVARYRTSRPTRASASSSSGPLPRARADRHPRGAAGAVAGDGHDLARVRPLPAGRTGRSRSWSSSGTELKRSAGILPFRTGATAPELLVVHPGGPYWARRDEGAWSIPKGEVEPVRSRGRRRCASSPRSSGASWSSGRCWTSGASASAAARSSRPGPPRRLDPATLQARRSCSSWPPRSGRRCPFPEVDRASGSGPTSPAAKLLPAQAPFVDRLLERLAGRDGP